MWYGLAGTPHSAVQHLRQLIVEMGSAPQARIIGDLLCLSLLDAACAPAVIQADLHDGRSLTETIEHARGSPQRPPTRQEFETKFRQCARDVLSAEQTLLAMRYLYQLDTLPDIRRLLHALSLAPGTT